MANTQHPETALTGLQVAFSKPLILASASSRRRDILRDAGFDFIVEVSNAEPDSAAPADPRLQQALDDDAAVRFALSAARAKALDVAAANPYRLIVAADTMVLLGNELLGKPTGPADAARMLRALSGKTNSVTTAIAIACADNRGPTVLLQDHETSRVIFAELTQQQIDDYVRTGEPLDKAGAYAVQGLGAALIQRVEGSFLNVVGLPITKLCDMLQQLGYPVPLHHNN
jgi:septum formation protein